ncbi:unnamed protein product [Heterobilharzia americana]|nr:unnamed protein product [Heterobilharzia americana]
MSQCPVENSNLNRQNPISCTTSDAEVCVSFANCLSSSPTYHSLLSSRATLPGVGSFLDKSNHLTNYSPVKYHDAGSNPVPMNPHVKEVDCLKTVFPTHLNQKTAFKTSNLVLLLLLLHIPSHVLLLLHNLLNHWF